MAHLPCSICGNLVGKLKKGHGVVCCRKCKAKIDKEKAQDKFINESKRRRKIY